MATNLIFNNFIIIFTLTLDILAKGQGVPSRRHPTMLAGGDQNQTGVSV